MEYGQWVANYNSTVSMFDWVNSSDIQWIEWFHYWEFSIELTNRVVVFAFVFILKSVWSEYCWHLELLKAVLRLKIQ